VTPIVLLTLALLAPQAPGPEAALEAAQRCFRRADMPCALAQAVKAIAASQTSGADAEIRREANALAAQALARLDRAPEAEAAFDTLATLWPGWRPPPDADPRVATAFTNAASARLRAARPETIDPGPPPLPNATPDPAELALRLPKPRLVRPTDLGAASDPNRVPRLALSLGAGVGIPIGDAADRVDTGVHAAIDFHCKFNDLWALWIQGTISLLPLVDGLPVEPGQGQSLTAVSIVVGTELAIPLADSFEAVLAAGVGFGAFGFGRPDQAYGLALGGVVGARWQAQRSLAVRLDFAPVMTLPAAEGIGVGGHLSVLVRGETRF
jgi:hypothetical protein